MFCKYTKCAYNRLHISGANCIPCSCSHDTRSWLATLKIASYCVICRCVPHWGQIFGCTMVTHTLLVT